MKKELLSAIALSACAIGAGAQDLAVTHPVSDRKGIHENQDWFEFRGFHYTDAKKDLPRVFLLGDSISGGYRKGVQERLEGTANVTWFTACYCVTTPNYMKLLEFYLDDADYAVIHINNGLHSFNADLKAYEAKLREALGLIRRKQPKAKIVWARTTPVADEGRNRRVIEMNEVADRVAKDVGVDGVDDLYAAMMSAPADRRWSDGCHPKPAALKALVTSVVGSVNPLLGGVKPREVTRTARGVPSDATVIYDETHPSLEQLVNIDGGPCRWKIQPDGTLLVSKEGNRSNKVLASAYTRDEYSDFQLHVEYLIPTSVLEETEPRCKLTRGNSGIKIFGRYEVQIIDSYRNEQDPVGTSGAVYANRAPLVNACLPPGEWQSYDIVFRAPRVKDGKVLKRASLTVLANGVLVQDHVEPPPYPNDGMSPLVTKGRVEFQSHNDKSSCISFRNIWIRPLKQ